MSVHDVLRRVQDDPEFAERLRLAAKQAAQEPFGQGDGWKVLTEEFAVTERQLTELPEDYDSPEGYSWLKTTTTVTTTVSPETTTTTTTTTLSKLCK